MKISFWICFLALVSVKFQKSETRRNAHAPDHTWADSKENYEVADGGYGIQHDALGYETFALAKSDSDEKQFDNNNNNKHFHNFAYEMPNDSKEQVYVFLDKGRTRYMPMDASEKVKITHEALNINGRHVPSHERHKYEKFGINFRKERRSPRHFPKGRNCRKQRGQHFRLDHSQSMENNAQESWNNNFDERKRKNCQQQIRKMNCLRNNQERRQKCAQKNRGIVNDERNTLTNHVATVGKRKNVQVQTIINAEVSSFDNSQSDENFLLGFERRLENSGIQKNDFIVGSAVEMVNKPQSNEKPTKRPANELLTDSETHHIITIPPKQHNNVIRTDNEARNSGFTDSPTINLTIQTISPDKLSIFQSETVAQNITDGENLTNDSSTVEASTENATADLSTPNEVNLNAQIINAALSEAIEHKNMGMGEDLETENNAGVTQNSAINLDLRANENRIYNYVTKLDGTALRLDNPNNQHAPIAYETMLMLPMSNMERKYSKPHKNFVTSKPKRNAQTHEAVSIPMPHTKRKSKPRRRKSKRTTAVSLPQNNAVERKEKINFGSNNNQINDNENIYENPRPVPRANPPANQEQNSLQDDTQILASQRHFQTDDLDDLDLCSMTYFDNDCENDDIDCEDYGNVMPMAYASDNALDLNSAEFNNLPLDCNDSINIAGDQRLLDIVGFVTPAPRFQNNDLCIT